MAQTIGIVGVFTAGDNLIEALPQKGPRLSRSRSSCRPSRRTGDQSCSNDDADQ